MPATMKNAIEKIDTDQYYTQAKYGSITNKVDVTPNEVADFFEQNKYQLPSIGDEIALSHLVMTPKLTPEHKQQLINKLMELKKRIVAGESFEAMARLYSEDPGSASQGGVMKNISKGSMVKPFEAGALNLQEGEMSGAIESEFGFHLIKLIKKSGKFYEAAHILLKAEALPK